MYRYCIGASRTFHGLVIAAVLALSGFPLAHSSAAEVPSILIPEGEELENSPGAQLFEDHCSDCHDGRVLKAPQKIHLRIMPAATILRTLTSGAMARQAGEMSLEQKQSVAEYLSGQKLEKFDGNSDAVAMCESRNWFNYDDSVRVQGWGFDVSNSRYIANDVAKLSSKDVANLKVKWAFPFPNTVRIRSQPAYAGGALYVGSQDGTVYAIDAQRGCIHWTFLAAGEVRTAISVSSWGKGSSSVAGQRPSIYFADFFANVYSIDALTGKVNWKVKIDEHPDATITGSPILYESDSGPRIFVPVSSLESVTAARPDYACCTFRGSVVSMDARTGKINWKQYTVPKKGKRQKNSTAGVAQYGPSGAAVWNTPTIDQQRGLIYFGTGQNYSSPADGNSDAIFALNIDTGALVWQRQFVSNDAFNLACPYNGPNCPKEDGPDLDFGASPVLVKAKNGSDVLVVAQKTGIVYGLDPNNKGKTIWSRSVGRGSSTGGVHFGLSAAEGKVYVPIYDPDFDLLPDYMGLPMKARFPGEARPGIHTLDALTGELLWSARTDTKCAEKLPCEGYSAAISSIQGAVLGCSRDGICRAYDSSDGKLLWQHNTSSTYKSLGGGMVKGGSIGGPGPMVASGHVYITSGYYALDKSLPGNVLLAFEPKK